jgi:hypothetical protein
MAAEWRKQQPCMALIQDRLQRTKVSRRRLMANETPVEVLSKYPIFTSFKMVSRLLLFMEFMEFSSDFTSMV